MEDFHCFNRSNYISVYCITGITSGRIGYISCFGESAGVSAIGPWGCFTNSDGPSDW